MNIQSQFHSRHRVPPKLCLYSALSLSAIFHWLILWSHFISFDIVLDERCQAFFHYSINNYYTTVSLYDPFLWIRLNCLRTAQPLREDSLLLTTKTPGDPGIHLIDLVNFEVNQWFWTCDPWLGNLTARSYLHRMCIRCQDHLTFHWHVFCRYSDFISRSHTHKTYT